MALRAGVRSEIRIGISGWLYKPWRGVFYPDELAHRRELEYASRQLNSIEMNGTFYSLKRPGNFASWSSQTPDDFVFSIKGSSFITHTLRLRNAETALANFFAQGLLCLGKKLGPVLWQLPPNLQYDRERLEEFFELLPRTHREAAELAARHDEKRIGRAWTKVSRECGARRLRHALEFRNESFVHEGFIALLRKYKIAMVVADTVEWPLLMDVTSDFVYCRLHGSEELYASGYGDQALDTWAQRILAWAGGGAVKDGRHGSQKAGPKSARRDVFVYFDNDVKVRAPFDAMSLSKKINTARGDFRAARHSLR